MAEQYKNFTTKRIIGKIACTEGDVDLSRLIGGSDAGVFAKLRNQALFRQV